MTHQQRKVNLPCDLSGQQHNPVSKEAGCVKYTTPRTKSLRIGTWNVRGLNATGKMANVIQEMERLNVDIMGISETFWKESNDFQTSLPNKNTYIVINCGEGNHRKGVAFILNKEIAKSTKDVMKISDRIIAIRIAARPKDLLILQVYTPTENHDNNETQDFYSKLEKTLKMTKYQDIPILMGNFNAKVGANREGDTVGPFGLGNRNHNGQHLVDFCISNQLTICNTWYECPPTKRYTWTSPDQKYKNQIDFIIIKKRYRNSVTNCKARPGADCGSGHNPVIGTMRTKLKTINKKMTTQRWNLEGLNNPQEKENYTKKFEEKIREIETNNQTIEFKWKNFKESLETVAKEIIGKKKSEAKTPWIKQETLNLMEDRRRAKLQKHSAKYLQLKKEVRRKSRQDKEEWYSQECNTIKELNAKHHDNKIYYHIKKLQPTKKKMAIGLLDKNELLFENAKRRKRWLEYGQELYGTDYNNDNSYNKLETRNKEADTFLSITLEELKNALRKLNTKKTPGTNGITAELLKPMGDQAQKYLLDLINDIYRTGEIPKDFTRSIMITIPKVNNAKECKNFRTISLISHTSKILLHIILQRISNQIQENVSEDQLGFRPQRGTREAIFQMHTIIEHTYRDDRSLYLCFIDFEKAFDRIDHNLLNNILDAIGINSYDLHLIRTLYKEQEAAFRVDGELTDWFKVQRGVRQGCLLSPSLFNIYSEKLINEALEGIEGISIGGKNRNNIRYADDTVILTRKRKEMKTALENLNKLGEKYKMKINLKKTKFMSINNKNKRHPNLTIQNHKIEEIDSYRYLGSLITNDGRNIHEVNSRIAMAKQAFWNCKEFLRRDIGMTLKKDLLKCYMWPVLLYGCETWTFNKMIETKINSLDIWFYRRMLKVSWTEKVTNNEIWRRANANYSLLNTAKERKMGFAGHVLRGSSGENSLQTLEGFTRKYPKRGRPRTTWIDNIKKWTNIKKYQDIKRMAEERECWRRMVANLRHGDGT
uniref:Endonuclease-reverse transcriptase n=1 Tax=Hadrurus spadix TaxID=141984 RepID=A0A1W7RAL1_9SCOR